MRFDSTVAPVPRVDRVLGAFVTLAAAVLVTYALAILLIPDASTAGDGLSAGVVAVAVVAGSTVTAWLLLDGYDRFRVPVEGRRWIVELAAFGALFAAAQLLVTTVAVLPTWLVFVAALAALYASSLVGTTVADARNWYHADDDDRET